MAPHRPTPVNRLLTELSWGTKDAARFRDGILESPGTYVWIEAKRADGGGFQPDQLAREYYCVTKAAAGRRPLLLLLTGDPPPLSVKSHGLLDPHTAVAVGLPERYARHGSHPESLTALLETVPERVAWLTWERVGEVLDSALAAAGRLPPEVGSAIGRIVAGARGAIAVQRAAGPSALPGR